MPEFAKRTHIENVPVPFLGAVPFLGSHICITSVHHPCHMRRTFAPQTRRMRAAGAHFLGQSAQAPATIHLKRRSADLWPLQLLRFSRIRSCPTPWFLPKQSSPFS